MRAALASGMDPIDDGAKEEVMTIFDTTLNDDEVHERVVLARKAGRDWATGVWEELDDAARSEQRGQPWYGTQADAIQFVELDPFEEIEDLRGLIDITDSDVVCDVIRELAAECNEAASDEWNSLAVEE